MTHVAVIGLEIHAELDTKTKLFCRCRNTASGPDARANCAVCPACLGLPGALPVLNEAAVKSTIQLGLSLGCAISNVTKWDRKNYFYPDLPKGYQISQYEKPLCSGGNLNLPDGQAIALKRIHLEEDTGKLTHLDGDSLIDYNRSSIPLLELVTEPVITSAADAMAFAKEFQHHLRDLGIAEASMEKGQMRCEANISAIPEELATNPVGRLSGVKVEIKNLNSFRFLGRAIESEIARQRQILAEGGSLTQETRRFDEARGQTYPMRAKESSDDYRYFPDPDLLPLNTKDLDVTKLDVSRANLRAELNLSGAKPDFAQIVTNDPVRRAAFFRWQAAGLKARSVSVAVEWLAQSPMLCAYSPEEMALFFNSNIDSARRKEVLTQAAPGQLRQRLRRGPGPSANLEEAARQIISENPESVARYHAGEVKLFGFFVGQVKKALGGGNPHAIAQALKKQLGQK